MSGALGGAACYTYYGVRLFYATKLDRYADRILVQEDRWLFRSASAEEAFREAIAGAEAAVRVGQSLMEAQLSSAAFQVDELDRPGCASFPPDVIGQIIKSNNAWNRADNHQLIYAFVGSVGPRSVGGSLDGGTEVDRYELSLHPDSELEIVTPKPLLMAFDPSGPAFTEEARKDQNLELLRDYHWYLAEEMFQNASGSMGHDGQTKLFRGSFVLFYALSPDEAYNLALADGPSRLPRSDLQKEGEFSFIGLRELSLITDDISNRACILRTDEYWTTVHGLRRVINCRPELDTLLPN